MSSYQRSISFAVQAALSVAIMTGAMFTISAAHAIDYFTIPVGIPAGDPNARIISKDHVFTEIPGLKTYGVLAGGMASSDLPSGVLQVGNFLFSPEEKLSVPTHLGVLNLKEKSIAMMFVTEKSVSIYSLDEDRHDGVTFTVTGKAIVLRPGSHATVTTLDVDRFAKVNFGRSISHRNLQTESIGKLKVFKSEFNIFTALNSIESLHKAAEVEKGPERKSVDHLLKTAAIQKELANGAGQFIQTGGPITFQFETD
jgi:hypothetical protein